MVGLHLLAVIGSTGTAVYIQHFYPGIWNWFLLIGLTLLNYVLIKNMFESVNEIINIKKGKQL
jgi:hypothetical protein